jgi:hypothetical protein
MVTVLIYQGKYSKESKKKEREGFKHKNCSHENPGVKSWEISVCLKQRAQTPDQDGEGSKRLLGTRIKCLISNIKWFVL